MEKLTQHKKDILKDFVDYICENCHNATDEDKLVIHRINRGYMGGKYVLRNILVICNDCHKKIHQGEFK